MRPIAFFAAALALSAASTLSAQSTDWIAGCWQRQTPTGVMHESWRMTPDGLDGGAATYRGDTLSAWEFLRIGNHGGQRAYIAAPNGQAAHAFPLVASGTDSLYFADPAHDFPQHIVYRRVGGDSLQARVWSGEGATARGVDYRFTRRDCETPRTPGGTPIDLTRAVSLRDSLQLMLDSVHALGRAPGLSAAVALPDGRVITVTRGVADSIGMVPLRANHRLLAGSVGKTFFAALALDLVAKGQLDLNAPISRWLSDEPWFARLPNGADITVRQLMNHTSGLVRYEFKPEFARDLVADPLRDWKVAEQLEYVLGDSAPFAAGTSWQYSDTNYLVLALIVERIIGGTAYDAIRTQYLAPLRLRGTVPSVGVRIPRLANGYVDSSDPLGMAGPMMVNGLLKVSPKFEWAGGGFASTPEDLARWAQMWYQGRAFAPAVVEQALEGVPAVGLGAGARYGLGVIVRDTPRGITYGHSGFFPGYLTEMRYYTESGVAVAVQANTSDQRAIGRGLGAIAHVLAERAMAAAPRDSSSVQAQEQPPPLRRLLVVDGDTVQLGRSLGTLARFVMFPGDTAVRFPPGMFEGADGAMAFFDSTGTVQRIGFLFGERHNMDTMLGTLYRDHGRTPRYISVPIPEGVRETWTWYDRETELAFTRFTPAQSSVAALLMVSNLLRRS